MKIFIDTANLDQIAEAHEMGVLDGVTTNPSLMAKEGIKGTQNVYKHYQKICEVVDGHVSAEVISTKYEDMIAEAETLASLHSQIVVKVPMIESGIKAINYLDERKIPTNCTLVFSVGQALLAAKAGATYISPFIGRIDDLSTDGMQLIRDIIDVLDNYEYDTEVLAASVRHPLHVAQCAKLGVDVFTAPLGVIQAMMKHPLTDIGLEKFLADHKKNNS